MKGAQAGAFVWRALVHLLDAEQHGDGEDGAAERDQVRRARVGSDEAQARQQRACVVWANERA
eukprot:6034522-Pleurochrysis_carterae.AAC.2